MTDHTAHDLIQRLTSALDDRLDYEEQAYPNEGDMPLINEARAYLAAPDEPAVLDGGEPTDEELRDLWQDLYGALSVIGSSWGGPTRADVAVIARAVLARYGNRTPMPIPLAERQPTLADRDAEGGCWWWHPESLERNACWCYSRGTGTEKLWLPHWALPVPETGNKQ